MRTDEGEGYRRLAAGVIGSALKLPARQRDAWLRSEAFADWCAAANTNPDIVRRDLERMLRRGIAPSSGPTRD